MEDKSATSAVALRNEDAFKTPNPNKPPIKAPTVSAAGLFKARKLDTPLQSVSRSKQGSNTKRVNKMREEEELHPLALAFKVKSEDYRRHLYSVAASKIDTDLDTLLNKLYESNLQVASSDAANEDPQASPLKLTVPVKYQRMVQKLCQPLSIYRYNLQRTMSSGEIERTQTSLHDRFETFEKKIQAETEQIKELQRQWESVVAEIFQVGVACLGETDIFTLLSTANIGLSASSPASKAESTIFVPEDGSPNRKGKEKRKRVSFANPDLRALFPDFLFQTTGDHEAVLAAPVLRSEEIQRLEKQVQVLGKQHSADLHRLEHEHKAWWEKKQKRLVHTLMQD